MGPIWPFILLSLILIPIQAAVVYFLWRGVFRILKAEWQSRATPKAKRTFILMMAFSIAIPVVIVAVMVVLFPGT